MREKNWRQLIDLLRKLPNSSQSLPSPNSGETISGTADKKDRSERAVSLFGLHFSSLSQLDGQVTTRTEGGLLSVADIVAPLT